MQELTPVALWALLFLVFATSAVLTVVGTALILVLYRRSVVRAMNASGTGPLAALAAEPCELAATPSKTAHGPAARNADDGGAPDAAAPASKTTAAPAHRSAPSPDPRETAERLERALRAPREAAWRSACAGLLFALVLAGAYVVAIPAARTPWRFALTLWVDLWPIVPAIALTAPSFWRWGAIGTALYFVPFVIGTGVAAMQAPPLGDAGSLDLARLRDSVTPPFMLLNWAIFAGVPTAGLLLFLHRRTRAVSPLLLAFTTVLVSVCVLAWLAVFTETGKRLFVGGAVAAQVSVLWLLLGALVAVLVLGAALGWLLLRWVRRAYLARAISDRSLALDALWLVFAGYYGMQFAVQGIAWTAVGALAFAVGRLGWRATRPRDLPSALDARGLTFLRVFALGPRSDALLAAVSAHWRRIGSVQLITGPDVAHSTLQPHQLLDFISGRLARHFIRDAQTLDARFAALERGPDPDGWHRIHNFFCHADTWQAVVARLVREGDVVLMDLRSFSARNAGCRHELHHLLHHVPLGRCVFVVDATTDRAELDRVVQEEAAALDRTSPNRDAIGKAPVLHVYERGSRDLHGLLTRLCQAA